MKTERHFSCPSTDNLLKVCRSSPKTPAFRTLSFACDRTGWRRSIVRSVVCFGSCTGRVKVGSTIWKPAHANYCHTANQGESGWVGRRNTIRSTGDPGFFQPRSMESWTSSCAGSSIEQPASIITSVYSASTRRDCTFPLIYYSVCRD